MTDEYADAKIILSRGKLKYSDKNLLQYHFDITDPTWTALGLNPDLCGKKPTTNHQRYGTDSMHSKKRHLLISRKLLYVCVLHKNVDVSTTKLYFELISSGFYSFSFIYGFWLLGIRHSEC